jgi:hypothetical protein
MTGRHSLPRGAWINERGTPRPALIRPPRWLIQAWARIDHARYVARFGHAGPSDGRMHAYYRRAGIGIIDGAVTADGERQTIRAVRR